MVRKLTVLGVLVAAFTSLPAMAADRDMDETRGETSRRSTGEAIDDATITTKVKSAFVNDDKVSALDVKVKTNHGIVQLSGFADSQETIRRAEKIAKSVGGVKEVKNDLRLRQ